MGSEVQTVEGIGTLALKEPGATLGSIADAMLSNEALDAPKKPKAAVVVAMTDALVGALTVLPAIFAKKQVTEIRQLSPEELETLAEEYETLDTILKPLKTRQEAIKETVRHHLDQRGLASGRVTDDTEVDSSGHYIFARPQQPDVLPMPGTDKQWSNQYSSGSPSIQGEKLLALYEANEITRDQYLALTREVRVFDEEKAFKSIAKDPSLLGVFKMIIRKGRPGNSLYVRNR